MKKLTLEWLAGFMDGEGFIGVVKRDHKEGKRNRDPYTSYAGLIQINNTDRAIIERLARDFGGTLSVTKSTKKNWNDLYLVTWSGAKAKDLIERVILLLQVKRADAKLTLDFLKYKFSFPRRNKALPWTDEINERFNVYYCSSRLLHDRGDRPIPTCVRGLEPEKLLKAQEDFEQGLGIPLTEVLPKLRNAAS